MSDMLAQIADRVEKGKINKDSPYPPDLKGQDGADELTRTALDQGVKAGDILSEALVKGMERIGVKFRDNKVFVPQVLMSAKAMNAAMEHLRPQFQSGEIKQKGTFVIGTVAGDLHDIGKNIVSMMVEGAGWKVVDLGVDVKTETFFKALEDNADCVLGMSALLTTTMQSMEESVKEIKSKKPDQKIIIGGAPLTQDFCDAVGADYYSADPQGAVEYLNTTVS